MAYNINKSNGDLLVVVEDGTVDITSTSLTLVGKNYPGYGEFLNENLIHLMENFASTTAPSAPVVGQLWYDSANSSIKVYNGSLFVNAGSSLQLDQSSTGAHFVTFVANEQGTEPFKIARNKSLSIQPSSGNVAINKNSAASSKLEINNGLLTRTLQTPNSGTVVHLHGADNESCIILLDSYTGTINQSSALSSGFVTRMSRGTSATPTALLSNDFIMSFNARGHDGTGYSLNTASMQYRANQNWTSTNHGTRIEWWTTNNNQATQSLKMILDHNGDLSTTGDITAFNTSDISLKTDIEPLTDALAKITRLDGIQFKWNELLGKTVSRSVGVIAQQVNEVLPEAVKRKDSGFLGVDYTQLIPLLIEAIKDLKSHVDELKSTK